MPRRFLMNMGTPFFISKLKLLRDKYSVDKANFERKSIVSFISEELP